MTMEQASRLKQNVVPSVTLEDVKEAYERIRPFIHRTPVMTCAAIDAIGSTEKVKARLFMKCENLQKVGAFKIRGATNALLTLLSDGDSASKSDLTVITHSSGNHAQAISLAARTHGVQAEVIMPSTSPAVKRAAVEGYGARVFLCEPTLQAREATMYKRIQEIQDEAVRKGEEKEKRVEVVPPYDDVRIVAGQGTATLEMVEQVSSLLSSSSENLDVLVAPVGGGGLLSGTAVAAKGLLPDIFVVGAEPKAADDAKRSFDSGVWVPSEDPKTVADGLRTSTGRITFALIKRYVDAICTAEEDEILKTMKLVYERMKLVIEPSAAVPLAVILYSKEFRDHLEELAKKKGKSGAGALNVGLIFSGGNVDLGVLGDLFAKI